MTTSLKGYLPVLSRILGETPDALYERQRALVREGLLESLPGHGRGSGVRATAESVAMLFVGLIASTNLSGAGPAARTLAKAKATHSGARCPLTGAKTFQGALARIFSDQHLADRVTEICVTVTHGTAVIAFDRPTDDEREAAEKLLAGLERAGIKKVNVTITPLESTFGRKSSGGGLYRVGDGIEMEVGIRSNTIHELTKAVIQLLKDAT